MLYVAVPIAVSGGRPAVVRASAPRTELSAAGSEFTGVTALFALALLGVSLAAALLLSRSILRPLAELSDAVRRFADGDFSSRIYLHRKDEVTRLAEGFNEMGEKVQGLFSELTRRTDELDGIFSSVTQGIALIDGNSRIIRSNHAFAEIVGTDVRGTRIWEVVRSARLMELLERARRNEQVPAEEFEIGKRSCLCTVVRMGEELITVLQDMSGPRRLEEIKRDFVMNASHELRTPLTAIRGFLELLEGDLAGEKARWLDAVKRNTDRMTAIVEDLLRLTRLEGSNPDFSPVSLDLAGLVGVAAETFSRRAEEKGISLIFNLSEDLPRIHADPFYLEQMLVNLIDNAVKYTENGEIRVSIAADGNRLRLEVADTGIGIAPEHISRIFERFYVVDKSRSRKLGGTGLGLSIVKHIVQIHGGTIGVESTPGKGSRFIVRLPMCN
jgi:two-component system phosphate regulon sensor histidine kinase PhoR